MPTGVPALYPSNGIIAFLTTIQDELGGKHVNRGKATPIENEWLLCP